jgi:hypothetical protein
MDVFTSITLNYLPKARILAESIKKFHPDWILHVVICDRLSSLERSKIQVDFAEELFDHVAWLDDFIIPDLSAWIFKHNVVELCTAVKGYYLDKLVKDGAEKIMYIDPDIVIFNNLDPLDKLLDEHAILLIPHLVDYTDDPHSISDNEINGTMRHGTFNFGFLGVNSTKKDGARFTDWWWKRLFDYCYADYDQGLFTDQKWGDLIPSFFEDYHIVRDPGYDVASWNLDCRQVIINNEGQLRINENYPLRFYHYTGYDSGAGMGVINYLTAEGNNSIVNELWGWYNHQLMLNGQKELGGTSCSFDFFENGDKVTNEMRKVYRTRPDLQARYLNPYRIQEKDNFLSWWMRENRTG